MSIYSAPARAKAEQLQGLPPTFLDVGSAEVMRDEVVAFAATLWEAGGQAELHVWSGAFHGFEGAAPEAKIAKAATSSRLDFVERVLGEGECLPD